MIIMSSVTSCGYANVKIALEKMPSQNDVEESKLVKLADQLREMLAKGGYERYARTVEQVMGEEYTALDVAAVLLSMQTGDRSDCRRAGCRD